MPHNRELLIDKKTLLLSNSLFQYKLDGFKLGISFSDNLFQYKLDGFKLGLSFSDQVHDIIKKHEERRPFHLNVIEAVCHGTFRETGHSLVLADMLKHPDIRSSFLERFLNLKYDALEVTAERARIDVALKGDGIFVIIENKVNAAKEEESQVYRYVHEIGIDKYGYKLSEIYVIYLNPETRDNPSEYSLCDENKENNVFEALGEEHYKVLSYKYDIIDWLRGISIPNEPHIESALDQYLDFLENKFHTTLLDTEMNKDIREFLLKELQIESKPLEEQISDLDSQYEKTKELLNFIDSLKIELRKELSHDMIEEWQKRLENEKLSGIQLEKKEHSFGIPLKNGVWLGIWDGSDTTSLLPYWGFQYKQDNKENIQEVYEQIDGLLEKARMGIESPSTDRSKVWIAWKTIENGEDGVKCFIPLFNAAKEMNLL
ncbi:PD-(D/E)XK nuclease family protein [Porphyromonas endodontalis]|uniref:PD-(D/E)XK nuclease family protein n=1 Tax=Porphyromonas endodontalis TaxID=28124 RepID=UPI00287FFE90|nr:PD-(D/E)XK nuclease family protein [Porphyromonas endodontalis]